MSSLLKSGKAQQETISQDFVLGTTKDSFPSMQFYDSSLEKIIKRS